MQQVTRAAQPFRRPGGTGLPASCVGVILGIALQLQQRDLAVPLLYAGLCGVGLLVALGCVRLARARTNSAPALVPIAGWVVGLALMIASSFVAYGSTGWRATAYQDGALDPALEGRDIAVTGIVLAMPQPSEDALRFRFGVETAQIGGERVVLPRQIQLGWYAGFGSREAGAAVIGGDDPSDQATNPRLPQQMRAGERWQLTLRLKAPHGNSNPHGFDYELWLWEQGLQATGYVRAGAKDAAPQRLSQSWRYPVERARQAAREAIFERVQNRQLAGIVAALVVGDQNAIERADWDVFRATGVAHLMSISGLHITMFAWLAALLIGVAWRRSALWSPRLCLALPASTAGALGGLLLATAYALFSGWGVPAQRTICMLAVVVLLRLGGRQWPWPQTWLAAMAVVLAFDPWALLQAGFWLSFVAVGILFAAASPAAPRTEALLADEFDHPAVAMNSGAACARNDWSEGQSGLRKLPAERFWANPLRQLGGSLMQATREQWTVTLALTPLSLLLFNQMSLVGLPANALAIPWVTLVVTPLAMLGLVWAPLWDAAAWAIGLLALFLHTLAAWPWAALDLPSAPLVVAIAGVAGGALLALRLPWRWRALGVPLLLPVLLWQTPRVPHGQFELLAADIGQGNAVLVRTASHALLYDSGPRFSRESDAGHRVLVPLLRAIGEPLDTLVLSHRDLDHVGGAAAVLAMQPQAALLASIEGSHELQTRRPATRCVAGQNWNWDGVRFEILHPQAVDYDVVNKSNALSCVLRISNGSQTALLTGDIEAAQEARLVASAGAARLKADFLLVPHHGSKTSSSALLLDAVQPLFAVAQAGYRNRYGHPAASVAARYDERGITLVRSPACGAARWQSAEPAALICQRELTRRYWQHRVSP